MIYTDTEAACDRCSTEYGSAASIKETRALIKEKGWVRRKNRAGEWEDLCDVCKHLKEKPAETSNENEETTEPDECTGCTKPTCAECTIESNKNG